jgi:type IV pilus assembly protein PilB
MYIPMISRLKVLAKMDIAERRIPQDGAIALTVDQKRVDLRVSTVPTVYGEKMVMRILTKGAIPTDLTHLGFSRKQADDFEVAASSPHGLLLVTGPTGSGKSTTLYSVLKELNSEEINICTVEDPVEYKLSWVNQFQVNDKIGFTFASSLRSLLRQDPDVIMVGEIRDNETARIAVQAALTGHLVLSTLHTNDAPGAITRLLNVGIEPYLVAASVMGVLAQRLVRKICTNCKELYEPPVNLRKAVERMVGDVQSFYHGAGCAKCRHSGFSGRIGIYELLVPDDAMRDNITAAPSINELRALAGRSGMISLRQDGMEKVKAGITTIEEVLRVTT